MTEAIVADVHERPSRVPWHLERLEHEVRIEALVVGDYVIGTGVLVERKTVRGLHTAVVQGTFWAQIGRLRRAAREAFLLVEGPNLDHGSLPASAIRGVCLAVMEQRINVIRSMSAYDSALWLARLASRSRQVRGRALRPVHDQRPAAPAQLVPEAVLSAIPGVSVHTAQALLRHFGSVECVVAATPEQLHEVAGVGPARATALLSAFSRASSLPAEEGRMG